MALTICLLATIVTANKDAVVLKNDLVRLHSRYYLILVLERFIDSVTAAVIADDPNQTEPPINYEP